MMSLGISVARAAPPSGHISTIAGGGVADGLSSVFSILSAPKAIAIDQKGNIYISDPDFHRVRKIDYQTGIITTYAGNGTAGFSGDNQSATKATLNSPNGLAINTTGDLFIADSNNNRVRMVDKISGIITTVAGDGNFEYSGDGTSAIDSSLKSPQDVAIDKQGNLLIADTFNNRIRAVDLSTGIITTIAGDGSFGYSGDAGKAIFASFRHPEGITVNQPGNIFVADSSNHRIRRIEVATGVITTFAGNGTEGFQGDNGTSLNASLFHPTGIAFDLFGNLYISDTGNHRLRRVAVYTSIITTSIGTGNPGYSSVATLASEFPLYSPKGVAIDSIGNPVVVDTGNRKVHKLFISTGTVSTIAGTNSLTFSGDGGLAVNSTMFDIKDVTLDAHGNIFIADTGNQRIRRIDVQTGIITTVAGNGGAGYSGELLPALNSKLRNPQGIAVDTEGNIIISDTENSRIRLVDSLGIITTIAGTGSLAYSGDGAPAFKANLRQPRRIELDHKGNLYISDTGNHRIRKIDYQTKKITTVAGVTQSGYTGDLGLATSASLNLPEGVSVDLNENIYIADTGNHRIRRVDFSTGIITTVAGNGESVFSGDGGPATNAGVPFPSDVKVTLQGNIVITSPIDNRVRMIDANTGIITTIAGDGRFSLAGDDGPAVNASLKSPSAITSDNQGNILIADTENHRIRTVGSVGSIVSTPTPTPTAIYTPPTYTPTPTATPILPPTPTPTPSPPTLTPTPVVIVQEVEVEKIVEKPVETIVEVEVEVEVEKEIIKEVFVKKFVTVIVTATPAPTYTASPTPIPLDTPSPTPVPEVSSSHTPIVAEVVSGKSKFTLPKIKIPFPSGLQNGQVLALVSFLLLVSLILVGFLADFFIRRHKEKI